MKQSSKRKSAKILYVVDQVSNGRIASKRPTTERRCRAVDRVDFKGLRAACTPQTSFPVVKATDRKSVV